MEVFTHPEHQLLVNITALGPKLLARGLPPDSSLFLRVYASTAKGRSRSVTFEGYTLRMAHKQTGTKRRHNRLIKYYLKSDISFICVWTVESSFSGKSQYYSVYCASLLDSGHQWFPASLSAQFSEIAAFGT